MKPDKYKKLTIIAHLPHYYNDGKYLAYEPYVREIELWAKLFETVEIYTDVRGAGNPDFGVKTMPDNCEIKPIYMRSGSGLINNALRLIQLPLVFLHVFAILVRADFIQLRSPGSTTFVANILNRLLNKKTIVKWATSFDKIPVKSKILQLERKLLLNPPSNTRVLIYGASNNPRHISFFPALLSTEELNNLADGVKLRKWNDKIKFICVGRMFRFKNFDIAIEGLVHFSKKYPMHDWELYFIGDGEERSKLESMIIEGNISQHVKLLGSLPFDDVLNYYKSAHVAIMPGMFEGWPKVVNEAWATGCIPFVVNVGNATYPFKFNSNSGATFEPNPESFADSLHELLMKAPSDLEKMAINGSIANKEMTLEKFQEKIELLIKSMT